MKKWIAFLLLLVLLTLSATPALAKNTPLKNGDEGDAVIRLQLRLFDLGYYTFKPTGLLGSITQSTLQQFQQNVQLPETGTGDENTLTALFSVTAAAAPFRAQIPLTYTASSGNYRIKGESAKWSIVKESLQRGTVYELTNCASGNTCKVVLESISGHAHMRPETEQDAQALNEWLGSINSFYKCTITVTVATRKIAASLQWSGDVCCVYFSGSTSDVFNLPDAEHDGIIQSQIN